VNNENTNEDMTMTRLETLLQHIRRDLGIKVSFPKRRANDGSFFAYDFFGSRRSID
jgi:hypothetical protein